MSREVLQQALEALNKLTDVFLDTEGKHGDYEQEALNQGNKTILAIKAALAQLEEQQSCDRPEQMARLGWQYFECPACGSEGARAFPKPEEQQSCDKQEPLTDEQIVEIYTNWESKKGTSWADLMRAIEAAHGIGDKT